MSDTFDCSEDPQDYVRHSPQPEVNNRVWFNRLRSASIKSFKQLVVAFIAKFCNLCDSRKGHKLFNESWQNYGESIRDLINQFAKEMIEARMSIKRR